MGRLGNLVYLILIVALGCTVSRKNENPGVIVSADWLENQLGNPSLVVLHVGSEEVFDSIHIPGARYMDASDFTRSSDSLRNQLQPLEIIDSLLSSAGVNPDSRIVLYYEDEDLIARTARVYVTLDYAGLGDQTYVLNGGLPGWIDQEGETTDRTQVITEGEPELSMNSGVIADAAEINQFRINPDYLIIDSRSREEYRGKWDTTEHRASGGHIEGARFISYQSLLSPSNPNMFLDDDELIEIFKESGMNESSTVISYCNSGIRASVDYLVARHLGYKSKLFDGSFEEWEMLDLPLTQPVFLPLEDE